MVAAVWAVIGILGALLIAVLAESRSDRRAFGAKFDQLEARIGRLVSELGARIDGVRDGLETKLGARIDGVETQLRRLADAQAEMNGQLVVLRQMAHTHNAA